MSTPVTSYGLKTESMKASPDFQSLLFFHINSYWIYKYLTIQNEEGTEFSSKNPKLSETLKGLGDRTDFLEGYRLGEVVYESYSRGHTSGLIVSNPFVAYLDEKYPGYTGYLDQRLHAWAVPLSYRDYDRVLKRPGDHYDFDKRLNLMGSTASHRAYFRKLVSRVEEYIGTVSANGSPVGFVDVGCGDGALLRLIRETMSNHYPDMIYIGIDIDLMSNKIAEEHENGGIIYLQGDVSDPDEINRRLLASGYPSLDHYFHVRAFVDHNFHPPAAAEPTMEKGMYMYRNDDGWIDEENVLVAYRNHFKAWKPYVSRHGIGLLELHRGASASLFGSPSIAYEIFHFLSGQYIVEYRQFIEVIREAGWNLEEGIYLVPEESPAVSIGIYK